MLLKDCGVRTGFLPAWPHTGEDNLLVCYRQVQSCTEHTLMMQCPKIVHQKALKCTKINASAATAHTAPPGMGWMGSRTAPRQQGRAGAPPLPRLPGFTRHWLFLSSPPGRLSGRQHQSWAAPHCT